MDGSEAIAWLVCCGLPLGVVIAGVIYAVGSGVAHVRRAAEVKQQFARVAIQRFGREPPFFVFGEDGRGAVAADPEVGHVLVWTREVGRVRVLDGQDVMLAEVETLTSSTLFGGSRVERIDLKIQLRDVLCPYVSVCFLHAADRKWTDQAYEKLEQARTWEARLNALRNDHRGPLRLAGGED